jgi:hypothetical protein
MKPAPFYEKVIILLLVFLTIMACAIAVPGFDEGMVELVEPGESETERFQRDLMHQWAQEGAERATTETDLVLREGQILNVRLNYGQATDGESAWYQVLLKNFKNDWYDVVRYSAEHGFGGREWDNFHDYDFHITNFNEQLTQEQYNTTSLDGEYRLIISSSHGFAMEVTLHWAGYGDGRSGGWLYNNGLLAFDVP